ncbi:MAG: hypothetical protein PHX08_15185 [Lachnospiraceae bacterium]|nr:hypothetical protein [Lachnospiraceae bacterium]
MSLLVHADVTDGYEVYRSDNQVSPVGTFSTLSAAFSYINDNAASDQWILKVGENDNAIVSAATFDAQGSTVILISDAGVYSLEQTNPDVRHILVNHGNLILENIVLEANSNAGGVVLSNDSSITKIVGGTTI